MVGDDPADDHRDVAAPLAHLLDHERGERHVGAGQHRQPDRVDVLVDGGRSDRLRGLEQPGVDDLVAGVAQDAGDDLDPPVVPVEADLGDQDPRAGASLSDHRHFDVTAELGFHRRHHLTERGVGLGGVDQRRHQVDVGIGGVGAQPGEGGVDGSLRAVGPHLARAACAGAARPRG